mgnify:CR=1 FL=1
MVHFLEMKWFRIMASDKPLYAIALMILAMVCIPAGDAAGKVLSNELSVQPLFIAWSRFLIGAIFISCLMKPGSIQLYLFKDWRIWLRALFIIGGITSILTALRTEPIANVFAAFFIGPILSYFVSGFLLKEPITLGRTILLLIGFIGVLLVVKPGLNLSAGMMFAILAGCFYGAFLVASRWLATLASGKMMLFSQLSIGTLILAPFGVSDIPEITGTIASFTLMSALGSAIGNLFLILAYQKMQASRLAPLVYVQLVAATVFGIMLFGAYPDALALVGISVLLISGLASFMLPQSATAAKR